LLATLIITYLKLGTGRSKASSAETWLVRLPFSIYLGWITVATVANISDVLDYVRWNGFGIAPEIWMVIVLAAVLVITLAMNITRRDVAYTLVILWALGGIAVKQAGVPAVVIATWVTFGLVGVSLVMALFRLKKPAMVTES